MERSVYVILRTREALNRTCKEYQIPTDWMLDTGLISKVQPSLHFSINLFLKHELSFILSMLSYMITRGYELQIKFASVKLAKKYMKRVAMELQSKGTSEKDPALEYMLLQGVRFAFRIHQVNDSDIF